jgi:two-component system, NarL family, nitrate/nitrite response regulator NarL
MSSESAAPLSTLTNREREAAALVCEGRPNKNIAQELSVAEGTVKIHLNRIFQKLGIRSRSELMSGHFQNVT